MIRKLYHGSAQMVSRPLYGQGKRYNDYGQGFYCTESSELAAEWAVDENRDGFINRYELECDGLNILDLNADEYGTLHWLAILLENRTFDMPSVLAAEAKEYLLTHFTVDYRKRDAIIGYRADDSYFSFAQDFLNGTISYRQLNNALRLGNPGQQFVLKSPTSFDRIAFCGAEIVDSRIWYPRKRLRDRSARREYFDTERSRRKKGDIYVMQIMDEGMNADDPRLR